MRVYISSATSKTDGRGNIWQYSYDSNRHPVTVVAPDGSTTIYTYDPANLQQSTDALNEVTEYTYDIMGKTDLHDGRQQP